MGCVVTLQEALRRRFVAHKRCEKVVFTNGVFDILHRGHIEYLTAARELGNFLYVGLNSDESTRRIKGAARPIVNEEDRAYCLAALEPVDYVVLFDTDTPLELIQALKPDILVKGGDWKVEDIVGSQDVRNAGGDVTTIPYREGCSTTNLLEKISASMAK